MTEDFLVRIDSSQTDKAGEKTTTEFVTKGDFYFKNDCYYIIYKESKITGLENTTTVLKIYKDKAVLNRIGAYEQRQEFELNKLNISILRTPYGVLDIGTFTRLFQKSLEDKGGQVCLAYDLRLNNEDISYNELKIDISSTK